jgi:hypothetical protein
VIAIGGVEAGARLGLPGRYWAAGCPRTLGYDDEFAHCSCDEPPNRDGVAVAEETSDVDLLTLGTVATATMSAVAAIGSWRAAKQWTVIEQERHRSELRPQLDLRIAANNDDSGTAVMYVTLNGPVDLPTPGRIQLKLIDSPSDLRNKVLTTYALLGRFDISHGKYGTLNLVWGPWEFQGGLKQLPRVWFQFFFSLGTWTIRFGLCRPTRRLPTFSYAREDAIPSRRRIRLRRTSFQLDGVLFRFAMFVGPRVRTMRRVRLNDTRIVRLSRTRPPADTDWARGEDWASLYPPDRCQVFAGCKFGKWRWRIEVQATTDKES